jgi:hypothetical protein
MHATLPFVDVIELHQAVAVIDREAVLNGAALWTRNRKHYPMKDIAFFD